MIGFVSVLALLAGAVLALEAETISDVVKWGRGLAVTLAVVRFVEFTVQEWQWALVQIQKQGAFKVSQRSVAFLLLHVVWYGVIVGAAAAAVRLLR
jgi:hypothetical protein